MYIPIADSGDCSEGVTVTVIGSLDCPILILTTTSMNSDDSMPVNLAEVNSTINPKYTSINASYIHQERLLVESVITPSALFLLPAVIAGPRFIGTVSVRLKFSGPSAILSTNTNIVTSLIDIPVANVAVCGAVSKSTPPVSYKHFHLTINKTQYYLQQTLVTVLMV